MSLEDTQDSSYADSQDIQTSDFETKTENLSQKTTEDNFDKSINKKEVSTFNQNFNNNKIGESITDQELYDEILEKLDIKPREKSLKEQSGKDKFKEDSYPNDLKQAEQFQVKNQIEKVISQDLNKIQKLVKAGLINSVQGQNLKKQVLKKAFDKIVQTEKVKRSILSGSKQNRNLSNRAQNNTLEDFSENNSNFFTSEGRKEVLNYLKSNNISLGKDELTSITNIVRIVEKAAIDKYLQKIAHEKTLRNSNQNAKQRLTANAQKSSFSNNLSRTFTREQIGNMSSAEFAKYEPAIMEQLKKGQIR